MRFLRDLQASGGLQQASRRGKNAFMKRFMWFSMLRDPISIPLLALQTWHEFLCSNPMWYVNKLFEQAQVESLSGKSFLVRSSGGVVRIEKHGCGAELRRIPAG